MLVTTCPECETTFRITPGILEQASGQVRCGQCSHVFNGNSGLREHPETATRRIAIDDEPQSPELTASQSETVPEPVSGNPGATDTDTDTDTDTEQGDTAAESSANETVSFSGWYMTEEPPAAANFATTSLAADDESENPAAAASEPEWEPDSDSNSDSDPQSEPEAVPGLTEETSFEAEFEPETVAEPEPEPEGTTTTATATEPGTDEPDDTEAAALAADSEVTSDSETTADSDISGETSDPDWLPPLGEAKPQRRGILIAACVLLSLAVVGQFIHAFRIELATVPALQGSLNGFYGLFDVSLDSSASLNQYELFDLTSASEFLADDQGWLVIETRIRNNGPSVLKYPTIFVGLQDRWQRTIAGRYFSPEDYVVQTASDYSRLRNGQVVDAQFVIMDPDSAAIGFELQICNPVNEGFVCDGDAVFD